MNDFRKKLLVVALVAFAFYTYIDVSSQPLWSGNMAAYPAYYTIWQIALVGFLALILLGYHNVLVPLALLFMSVNGTEDFLYFVFQGQPIPATLPWLNSDPFVLHPVTATSLYLGVASGLAVLILAVRFSRKGQWGGTIA